MRVLILSNGKIHEKLRDWLVSQGENLIEFSDELSLEQLKCYNPEIVISFSYHYIIPKEVLDFVPNRCINLHLSLLPWNRGADPNFWSFFDDSPKGVTIHLMNQKIDSGEILLQKEIVFTGDETLRSTYEKLSFEIQKLFIDNWILIRDGKIKPQKQIGRGSYHKLKDKEQFLFLLKDKSYDTPVRNIIEYGIDFHLSVEDRNSYCRELQMMSAKEKYKT